MTRLALLVVTVCALSCDSSTEPRRPAFDHLEIRLTPSRAFYPVHDTTRSNVIAHLPNGATRPAANVVWRSLTPALASVDQFGVITMLARGNAIIEVESEGTTAQLQILVQGILHVDAIRGRQTWSAADGPHVIQGHLAVDAQDTAVLTIEPGARVVFRARSGLEFGRIYHGRIVIPPGAGAVTMEGDSAAAGSWIGLTFISGGQSELRNVTFRHCGAAPTFGTMRGCIVAESSPTRGAPHFLLEDVTIIGAPRVAMTLEPLVTLAPGSRNLSILDGDGHIAQISPALAGQFPLGGRLEGNAENAIWIGSGLISESTTWRSLGVPWRLVGQVSVDGLDKPVLTIPPGTHLRSDPFGIIEIGSARLVAGSASGPPVLLESSGGGWRGIDFEIGAGPSSLVRVVMRDCGRVEGACIRLLADRSLQLHVEDVTIRGSRGVGVYTTFAAQFAPTSTNLTITESADVPLEMPAKAVPSIPPGAYVGNGRDAVRVWLGEVTETGTWRNRGIPYLVPRDLDIRNSDNDIVLTLEAGVVLQMGAGTRVVAGESGWTALRAIGSASEPVVFESMTPGVAGSWMGVELGLRGDARTRLEYVEIRDAGAGDPGYAGAVRLRVDPGGLLRQTTIRRSSSCGVVLYGAPWTDDYADPQFGNVFVDVAGPILCPAPD